MKKFLLDLGKSLGLKEIQNLSEKELKKKILYELKKRIIIENSLFELSESFFCNAELSFRVISSITNILDRIYLEKDVNKFIEYCFNEFIKLIPAENISIIENSSDLKWIVLKSTSERKDFRYYKNELFQIEKTLAEQVFKNNEPEYVPDIIKDKRFKVKIENFPVRSLLVVPIKIRNIKPAVINFSHSQTNAFDESCVFFLTSMAKLFAIVLTNFELYREVQNFNEILKTEVENKTAELKKKSREFYKASITDALTGISNRRYFFQRLEEEFARFLRYGNSFCLIIFDLDNLKFINDMYGHTEGDNLIKTFAKVLKKNRRKGDIISRIGGDEFACIVFGTSVEGALKFAERIKENFKSSYKKASVSVSGAVECLGRGTAFKFYKDYKELFNNVDIVLLEAKKVKDVILPIETN